MEHIARMYFHFNQMMVYRGYDIDIKHLDNIEKFVKIFIKKYKHLEMTELLGLLNDIYSIKNKAIMSFWHSDKLGINEYGNIMNKVYEKRDELSKTHIKLQDIIIICEFNITPTCEHAINLVKKKDSITTTIFLHYELGYNPSRHILVPTYRICTKKEKQQILGHFGVLYSRKFPHIRKTDVQAKWLGCKVGQLLEITTKSYSLPDCNGIILYDISYRIVIP